VGAVDFEARLKDRTQEVKMKENNGEALRAGKVMIPICMIIFIIYDIIELNRYIYKHERVLCSSSFPSMARR
jgi:hypothetical protein